MHKAPIISSVKSFFGQIVSLSCWAKPAILTAANFIHKTKSGSKAVRKTFCFPSGRVRRPPDQLRLQAVHPAGGDVGRLRAAAEVDPAPHPPLPQPRHRRRRSPHILILALLLCQGVLTL